MAISTRKLGIRERTSNTIRVRATRRGITYRSRSPEQTIDVQISGRRVWSFKLPAEARGCTPWPVALQPRLRGSASCQLQLGSDGTCLWSGTVRWGGQGQPDLSDAFGRDIVINKWGRISHSFASDGDATQQRIMRLAERVILILESLGFPVFIVGGTLLGAVRQGSLLSHDDDADLAYLSPHSHPSDVVVENAHIEAQLRATGLRVIRHSWAHLQIVEVADAGLTEFYVDVFTAFVRGGEFFEPIHVRVPESNVQILPLSEVMIGHERYPAPASPEKWLAACYGPNWRTPDPGFSFHTPRNTVRCFYSWFGNYNTHRHTWNDAYHAGGVLGTDVPVPDFERTVSEATGMNGAVLDLGAGSGQSALRLQRQGHQVCCLDYAWSAPCHEEPQLSSRVVNLTDYVEAVPQLRAMLFEVTRTGAASDRRSNTVATLNRVLACQDPQGRAEILTTIGVLFRAGVRVFSCDYETLGDYAFERPTSWHLPEQELRTECSIRGVVPLRLGGCVVVDECGRERTVGIYELIATEHCNETGNIEEAR